MASLGDKNDKAYCIICRNIHILNQLTSKNKESAFITDGFSNWKDATRAFEQHHKSTCHKEATMKWDYYLKGILKEVRASVWYCVSADETVNASITVQLVVYLDMSNHIHMRFLKTALASILLTKLTPIS